MSRRIPLLALALAAPLLLVALIAGGGFGGWTFALVAMLVPGALIALAAGRRVRGAAVAVTVLLAGGAAAVLALGGGAGAGGALIGGLPVSAWVMLGAFWGWPLILTVWVYTATFEAPGGASPAEAVAGPGAGSRPPGGGAAGEPPAPEPGRG